jgi:hypothetical protein
LFELIRGRREIVKDICESSSDESAEDNLKTASTIYILKLEIDH